MLYPEPRNEPSGRQRWTTEPDRKTLVGYVQCDFHVMDGDRVVSQCGKQATWFAGGFEDEAACDEHAEWLKSL